MKQVFIYDNTFRGLLSVIYELITKNIIPANIVSRDSLEPDLFTVPATIVSDRDGYLKSALLIREKVSSRVLDNAAVIFLASVKNKEKIILEYVRFGLEKGKDVDRFLADTRVKAAHDVCRKVKNESYRLRGLLRFAEVDSGLLYARVSPDHFILPLLAGYFSRRLSGFSWIIHDVKRKKAAVYRSGGDWLIADVFSWEEPLYSEEEEKFRDLWKKYFKVIAIKSRNNPKLQRQGMPKKYWEFLPEMSG